jgi:5-methyltetrahydropteroyltriglutamate--homocysteine methyltransferase
MNSQRLPSSIPPIPSSPRILTTTVGSYPLPDWLSIAPSEQALTDAIRVVFDIQREAGIDLPTDGELCRFDLNHPETNGMIEYFIIAMKGVSRAIGRRAWEKFAGQPTLQFRKKPAGIVHDALGEGGLNLLADCARSASLARGPFKFTVTSPYMLARNLLDQYYGNFEALTLAVAEVLAEAVAGLPCACLQVDEANITGTPHSAPLGAKAINRVLDRFVGERAVHLCFGNYGGQTIQQGHWRLLIEFINSLHANHVVLELAHRPPDDLDALTAIHKEIQVGVGVVDVKINRVETPDEIARRIETADRRLGADRLRWVHPDCGFWMLQRSISDRKLEALVLGRNKYLGIA